MPTNQIRIIGGEWRSRLITFPDIPGLRPTPNRVRETLFNWLQYDIPSSRCLDLFAGSGALGFEAASRGAQEVIQIEQDPIVCQSLRDNANKLKATNINVIQADVLLWLNDQNASPFDIVFLDPPFGLNLAKETCGLLRNTGWLNADAKIYVECESILKSLNVPSSWHLLKSKTAGDVAYRLFASE